MALLWSFTLLDGSIMTLRIPLRSFMELLTADKEGHSLSEHSESAWCHVNGDKVQGSTPSTPEKNYRVQ